MIYTPLTKKALKLCFQAHKDQLDKGGLPYIFHPFHVAEQMDDEKSTVVALLHDVIEDTKYTLDDLQHMGFNEEILSALDMLTHKDNVPYMDYIKKIAENPLATIVKIADLKHNSNISRLSNPTKYDFLRVEKYQQALDFLCNTQQQKNTPATK